ncbi:MAG: ABC transporter permease subunit [bacterium]|nr:ABC transporter permease subunit [bacterium]
MRKTLILARREISGYFYSPVAYVIGALFLLASGIWFFHSIFRPGHPATLRPLFEAMAYIMVFATPLLTMRLISEEFRSGTFETLVTAPVTDTQVIMGKFLGVLAFYISLLACTGIYMCLVAIYGRPDPGVAVMGYCGMVLLGAAYLAVGLFASTLTTHQAVAAIVSVAILSVFAIIMQLLTLHAPAPWGHMAARLNAMTYFKDFARGMFDTRGVVFFVSSTALFLFLSVKMLESRRWK